jgi:hypothetical protein
MVLLNWDDGVHREDGQRLYPWSYCKPLSRLGTGMKRDIQLLRKSARTWRLAFLVLGIFPLSLASISCIGPQGSDSSSQALNGDEELAYKRAMLRCHKTGGSRVVKIEGNLRCF